MNVTIWLTRLLMFNLACIIALNFIVLYVIMTNSKVDRLELFIVKTGLCATCTLSKDHKSLFSKLGLYCLPINVMKITRPRLIHSFIADIYIAPLQVGLLRSAPNPSTDK